MPHRLQKTDTELEDKDKNLASLQEFQDIGLARPSPVASTLMKLSELLKPDPQTYHGVEMWPMKTIPWEFRIAQEDRGSIYAPPRTIDFTGAGIIKGIGKVPSALGKLAGREGSKEALGAAKQAADTVGAIFEAYSPKGYVPEGYMFTLTERTHPIFKGRETSIGVKNLADFPEKVASKIKEFIGGKPK